MSAPLIIDYYTDVLCIWGWIAQLRIDELNEQLGNKIQIRHHSVDIFGDVQTKMNTQWQDRGGYKGFAEHVQSSAQTFKEVNIHPDLWTEVQPVTSANAHLVIKAVGLVYDEKKATEVELMLKKSFFLQAMDISDLNLLFDLLEAEGVDCERVSECIHNGSAIAALMKNYRQANANGIKGSPTYVMDDGRQVLFGNVGYRVIQANIEELLRNPKDEASWC